MPFDVGRFGQAREGGLREVEHEQEGRARQAGEGGEEAGEEAGTDDGEAPLGGEVDDFELGERRLWCAKGGFLLVGDQAGRVPLRVEVGGPLIDDGGELAPGGFGFLARFGGGFALGGEDVGVVLDGFDLGELVEVFEDGVGVILVQKPGVGLSRDGIEAGLRTAALGFVEAVVGGEAIELVGPELFEADGSAARIAAEAIFRIDIGHDIAKAIGERAGGGAEVGFGGEGFAVFLEDFPQSFGEEMPADGGAQEHQEECAEEARVVAGLRHSGGVGGSVGVKSFEVRLMS